MMMKKYCPTDMMSIVEMRQKLNKVVMKKGSDPAILFETLAVIEDKYDGSVDEADLIAIVLDAVTDEYQSVLMAEESAKGSKLTLIDLELIMGQHYRRLSKRKTGQQVEENEVLLAGFNGACFNCGKRGHKANKCPERERAPE
jgi:Zinc knuckle